MGGGLWGECPLWGIRNRGEEPFRVKKESFVCEEGKRGIAHKKRCSQNSQGNTRERTWICKERVGGSIAVRGCTYADLIGSAKGHEKELGGEGGREGNRTLPKLRSKDKSLALREGESGEQTGTTRRGNSNNLKNGETLKTKNVLLKEAITVKGKREEA